MLKKVRVEDLRAGMHLHELCGSWLDHPFWKKRFALRNEADLAALRSSGVVECWIDIAKGDDVAAPEPVAAAVGAANAAARPPVAEPKPPEPGAAPSTAEAANPPAEPKTSLAEERSRAESLRRRSRESVTTLFGDARMGRALDVEACMPLVDDIVASVARNSHALVSLTRLKRHDDYTFLHSVAVCALMVSLAQKLELDTAACREAGLAGLLHDIGKAAMPLEVLNKPGPLTDVEFAVIKGHPVRGREMLKRTSVGPAVIDVCAHHHERPDGKGYPDKLSGDALSRFARMGAVCDVYDAITSDRPYKRGWDPAEAIVRMTEWTRQGQFDPVVFHAFVECMGIYPIGSLVRLQSGRLAVVVEQNPASMTSPTVRVFFSTRSGMAIPTETVDLAAQAGDRIASRESNERWKFPFLAELSGSRA